MTEKNTVPIGESICMNHKYLKYDTSKKTLNIGDKTIIECYLPSDYDEKLSNNLGLVLATTGLLKEDSRISYVEARITYLPGLVEVIINRK